jgi:hypothetical protein
MEVGKDRVDVNMLVTAYRCDAVINNLAVFING